MLINTEQNTATEIKCFIDNVKEDFLYFLKENIRSYPVCCDRSTQILMAYIKGKFGMGEIKVGFYFEGENKYFHVWGKIGDEIIDFTYFQFLLDKRKIKELSDTDNVNKLYDSKVKNSYESVFLKEEYKAKLQEKKTVKTNETYEEIAKKSKDFHSYLNHFKA